MMWSALRIIFSSCSTTITVLPMSRRRFSTLMRRSVSRGCSPMLGSSRIYVDPTRLLPKEVAKLMRCDSPPERVFESRFNVRYPNPTSMMKSNRLLISTNRREAIFWSVSSKTKVSKNTLRSSKGISTRSVMLFPPTFTYWASFFSREPWQSGQMVLPR